MCACVFGCGSHDGLPFGDHDLDLERKTEVVLKLFRVGGWLRASLCVSLYLIYFF